MVTLPNGEIASASYDSTVRIWNLTSRTTRLILSHPSIVYALAVLKNGDLCTSNDNSIRIWNTTDGTNKKIISGIINRIQSLAIFQNGDIAVGGNGYNPNPIIKIIDINTWAVKANLIGVSGTMYGLVVLKNGDLASGCDANFINIWNLTSSTPRVLLYTGGGGVYCVNSLQSGDLLVGTYDKSIRLVDQNSGALNKMYTVFSAPVTSLAVLPNSDIIGGSDKVIKIVDSNNGTVKAVLNETANVNCLTVLPNGNFVSGLYDGSIKVWSL